VGTESLRSPAPHSIARPQVAGVLAATSFVLVGWTALLVPSLIRSLEDTFQQSDAGIGLFYLLFSVAWAAGSYGGGLLTERQGRRKVLTLGAALIAIGLIGEGLAQDWSAFLIAGIPAGLGAGTIDGGGNGLVLDLFPDSRGRALNLLHLFFSVGALAAPAAIGPMVESGVSWETIVIASGVAAVPISLLFATVAMPSGQRVVESATRPVGRIAATIGEGPGPSRPRLSAPLILLGLAIAMYLASQVGVSSWLVRFLEPAPLSTATFALSLYWAGIAIGRLVSSVLADRFDYSRFTVACSIGLAIAILGAVVVPSVPASIALFAVAGVLSGPIFPMIVAIGGASNPNRTAAVAGFLNGTAVAGTIVYPPIMGFLSVTVGLGVAMLGNVMLALGCAGAIVLAGRSARQHAAREV
jgi:fucose permease